MYYEPTMTPPPPKIIFPTAETEPPSTPYPTNLQSPQITIRFEPSLTIQITTHQPNNLMNTYRETLSIITITVTTTLIDIVEKPSCGNQHQKQTFNIVHKTLTPVESVEKRSPQSPLNNKNVTPVTTVETTKQKVPI